MNGLRRLGPVLVLLALAVLASACVTRSADPSPVDPAQIEDTDDGTGTEPTGDGQTPPTGSSPTRPAPGPAVGWVDGGGRTVLFTDVTREAGVAVSFLSALEVELSKDTAVMMGGAGVGDFDNDGDSDLFVLGGGRNPDSLFINQGDGTFADRTVEAGLADLHLGSAVAVGDYDGDGWLDIFVASHGSVETGAAPGDHRLYRNNGDLTFTNVAAQAGVTTTSRTDHDGFGPAFGDIDLDGDLDLFVPGWQRNSRGNRLFENNGDGTFTDITDEAGIIDDGVRGFAACLVDTSGDFYPELLLVGDFSTSRYFANIGDGSGFEYPDGFEPRGEPPRFVEHTDGSGTGREEDGMGSAVGDFNNDGMLDWYATAIFDLDDVGRGVGNKLYLNQGSHSFDEVAAEAGVDDGGWGWGTVAVDINHDGWLDLIETNGWDLPSYVGDPARTWIADGTGGFTEVASEAGPVHTLHGLGVVNFDLEGDGDQDIAITASNDEFRLYRNDLSGPATSWLRVFLETGADPTLAPNGIGAMVRATVGAATYTRAINGCSNFNSTSELSAHFGLGDATVVDELRIEWPNGEVTILDDVPVNQTLTVEAS